MQDQWPCVVGLSSIHCFLRSLNDGVSLSFRYCLLALQSFLLGSSPACLGYWFTFLTHTMFLVCSTFAANHTLFLAQSCFWLPCSRTVPGFSNFVVNETLIIREALRLKTCQLVRGLSMRGKCICNNERPWSDTHGKHLEHHDVHTGVSICHVLRHGISIRGSSS